MHKVTIGSATLYNADCLDVMREMGEGEVDAVITDPPYGIDIASNPFRQKFSKLEWDKSPIDKICIDEILRIGKTCIIWGGNYFDLPPQKNFLVWDKMQPFNFSSSMCEQAWSNIDLPAKLFRFSVISYKKEHPTQKPVELMKWCIELCKLEQNAIIFDPFMGSGTTGVACLQTDRKFIGVELDADYFEIACKRIRDAAAQPTLWSTTCKK